MEAAGLRPAEINMGITEIVLLIIGMAIFAASFFIPEKYSAQDEKDYKEIREKLKTFLKQELQMAQISLEEKTDEVIVATTEKAERYMERITNEKMLAVQEYSDTVLEQIHKNHEEAVFLYDMLNSKHDQIKITTIDINNKVDEVKKEISIEAEEIVSGIATQKIEESLTGQIQAILRGMVQESVHEAVKNINPMPRDTRPVSDNPVPVPVRGAEEFRQLSLEAPEIIIEEEQPLLIHQVKKVAPKKKTPARKASLPTYPNHEFSTDSSTRFEEKKEDVTGGANTNSNKEKILQLHHDGKSDVDIAKELGLGIGEVRLIIGLYK